MTSLARALLAELGPEDLAELAERLKPYLGGEDGWLGVKDAAVYAGCTVHALRHAIRSGEVEFEQHCEGGKVYLRRSALDRWRTNHCL
jgi:hypothetical protein